MFVDSGTVADPVTDASDLTAGSLVCGNPAKALRERRKRTSQIHEQHSNPIFEKVGGKVSAIY